MSVELNVATARFHGRHLHLHRLPGLDRIRPGSARRTRRLRCGGGRLRGRRQESRRPCSSFSSSSTISAAAHPVHQQDRPAPRRRLRDVLTYLQPASSKPLVLRQIADLEERHRHRLRRSRARARLRLSRACGERSDRHAGRHRRAAKRKRALRHAGEARRLRRRTDGAAALRHGAAARPGVRRSVARTGRRADHAGAVRLGRARQWHRPPAQGAAPRGARRRRQRPSASASRRNGGAVAQVLKTFHTAHGGKLSLARVLSGEVADGAVALWRQGPGCARRRPVHADGLDAQQDRQGRGRRHGGARPARRHVRPARRFRRPRARRRSSSSSTSRPASTAWRSR